MNKLKPYLIPLVIFSASLLLRMSLISKGPYHLDSLNLAIQAQRTLETLQLHSLFGIGYPLTVILSAFFIFLTKLFSMNDPVFAVNLMSVVTSSFSVFLFYLISEKLFGKLTAILSSILFSISPIFLGLSVFGMSHTPAMLFQLWGIFLLIRFHETQDQRYLWFSSIVIGLLGASRLQDMIFMGLPISCLLILGHGKSKHRPSLKHLILFWICSSAIAISFHLLFCLSNSQYYQQQLSSFWKQGTGHYVALLSWKTAIKMLDYFFMTFSFPGFLASIIGLILLSRKNLAFFFFLLLWIIVPLTFLVNVDGVTPRFLLIVLPPFIFAQGIFFAQMLELKPVFRYTAWFVYAVMIFLLLSFIYPILQTRHRHAYLPDYVRWVKTQVESNAAVIGTDDALFFSHYGPIDIIYGRPSVSSELNEKNLLAFKKNLDNALDQNTPVYISSVGLNAYDRDHKFTDFFFKYYNLEYVGEALYQDWHRDALKELIFMNRLWRIKKKS